MNEKITNKHLDRTAYVYIRQSTLQQVRHNVESGRRQYQLEDRARELGFEAVVVVDDDLGISGAGSHERPGFTRLLAAVCNGEVGGVFALEASRLARNNRDWHHLIDLCVLTETVVIDADGIYDPRLLNDRLLLGLKGTMSEFELGILRQRAQEAYRQKVLRGEVLTQVPIGYIRTPNNGIEMTPDLQIQEAIRGLFLRFNEVLIKDHHPGYISWDQFVTNRQTLKSNRTKMHQTSTGAARKGTALLAGLLRCTKCGYKLNVAYRGRDGRAPRYYCSAGNKAKTTPECLSFGGVRAENAVVDRVLEACQPLGVEASLQVLAGNQEEQSQKQRALELALEKARFEVDRARRQYDAADPDNRLVAGELENRWNSALLQVAEIEERLLAEQQSKPPLDDEQRERLMSLGADLHSLWNEDAAPTDLKKRLLRTVINEILVNGESESGYIEMIIHWVGGVHTSLRVRKNKAGLNTNATDKDIVEFVRELATGWRDPHIASILNRAGFRTGKGNCWNENRVRHLRTENGIPPLSKSTGRTWKTMSETANELNVSVCVVRTMVKNKLLPAKQVVKNAPWMIESKDLLRSEVQQYAKQARAGQAAPCEDNNQMLNL